MTIGDSRTVPQVLIRTLERGLGAALLVFALAPVYRALDTSGDAPFRLASIEIADSTLQFAWWGSLFVGLVAAVLTFLFSDSVVRFGRGLSERICRFKLPFFAAGAGLLAFLLALAVNKFLYQGLFTNMDEIASAIQARYFASGMIAGPNLSFPEAWLVTNTLLVDQGWVSQYPPSHLAFMALFYRLGIPAFLGPVMTGVMVWLLALSYPRLLPSHLGAARIATLLTVLSPFVLALGAGSLSHVTAGAAIAGILYASLRARDGSAAWGLLVGATVGIVVLARPLIGLVLGTAIPMTLWWPTLRNGQFFWAIRRFGSTLAGGLPFAVLLGIYNLRLFGGVTRFGYLAAFGSNHKLGFHLDPWGYMYGLESAIAFTSIDLLAVGVKFLETPIPLTVAVGVYLLLGPRLPKGSGTVLAWALLPLGANAYYWFHDPRMMFEAAPAWILLSAVGVGELISGSEKKGPQVGRLGQWTAWAVAVSLLIGVAWGIPTRWGTYSWRPETLDRIQVPSVPVDGPAIVFVHTSWNERLSARLQGAGAMRQDSIVSALRRNTNCDLHRFAEWREAVVRGGGSDSGPPLVDLDQASEAPEGLIHASLIPGMSIRTRDGETLTPACVREVEADRFGAVALAPLLWQGDLPEIAGEGILFVRDLGPERNADLLSLFPHRSAFVFSPFAQGGPPEIAPYADAMRVLWGAESEA